MSVAIFNLQMFLNRYPEFTALSVAQPGRLPALFDEAGFYLTPDTYGPVCNLMKLTQLLNMLTAHISYINGDLSADGQQRPVGRLSQAAEGSVSATFEGVPPTPGSGAWFQMSQYGAAFWQATSALRGFRYVVPASRCAPWPFRPGGWPYGR
jgi:hypothetical protein